jgi:hypothetical protein
MTVNRYPVTGLKSGKNEKTGLFKIYEGKI